MLRTPAGNDPGMTVASSEPSGTGPGRADRPDAPPAPGQEGADLDARDDADAELELPQTD